MKNVEHKKRLYLNHGLQVLKTIVHYRYSELGGLTGCITNNLDTCSETSVKNEIKAVKDIITYMCSPDGREGRIWTRHFPFGPDQTRSICALFDNQILTCFVIIIMIRQHSGTSVSVSCPVRVCPLYNV